MLASLGAVFARRGRDGYSLLGGGGYSFRGGGGYSFPSYRLLADEPSDGGVPRDKLADFSGTGGERRLAGFSGRGGATELTLTIEDAGVEAPE